MEIKGQTFSPAFAAKSLNNKANAKQQTTTLKQLNADAFTPSKKKAPAFGSKAAVATDVATDIGTKTKKFITGLENLVKKGEMEVQAGKGLKVKNNPGDPIIPPELKKINTAEEQLEKKTKIGMCSFGTESDGDGPLRAKELITPGDQIEKKTRKIGMCSVGTESDGW